MHAIRVRVLRTDLYCAVEFISVTETLICRFSLLLRSRVDLSSSSLWLKHSTRIDHVYTDDFLPYVPFTMFSYWGCGESCLYYKEV